MAKVYDYVLVLEQQNEKIVNVISQIMVALSVLLFLFQLVMNIRAGSAMASIAFWALFSCFIIAWWIYCALITKKGQIPYYRLAFMLAAWGCYTMPGGLPLACIYLTATILEKPVKANMEVAVDAEEVVVNGLPKKKVPWQLINNVVLKDGLLTIDYKNNRLFQRMVNAHVPAETEVEFNAFCQQQLQKHNISNSL